VSFENDVANKFCMAKATKYDVLCNKKKFAGAAQRKNKKRQKKHNLLDQWVALS